MNITISRSDGSFMLLKKYKNDIAISSCPNTKNLCDNSDIAFYKYNLQEKLVRIGRKLFLKDLELSVEAKHHDTDENQRCNAFSNGMLNLGNSCAQDYCCKCIH